MTRTLLSLLLLSALAVAPVAGADLEVVPYGGLRTGGVFRDKLSGERYEFDSDGSIGILLAWDLDGESFIEIGITTMETFLGPENSSSSLNSYTLDVTDIQIGGHYMWSPGPVKPFVMGSLGVTIMDPTFPDTSEELDFSFAVGGGLKYYWARHWGVRAEIRLLGTTTGGTSEIFCVDGECLKPVGTVIVQGEGRLGLIIKF